MINKVFDIDSCEAQIAAREAEITAKPPRIPPLNLAEVDSDLVLATYKKIRSNSSGNTAPPVLSEVPEIVMTVLRHPNLFESVSSLSGVLQAQGALTARDRQLVCLRTTWLCQAPYPFGEHARISKSVGITAEEIERVKTGSTAADWFPHERALMEAVEELHDNSMITDTTWERLSHSLDHKQMFELVILIGQFTLISYFQNALRMKLREGNAGLRAR